MNKAKIGFVSVIIVIVILAFSAIGIWNLKRKLNYKFGYESLVEQTVNKAMDAHIKKYHSMEK